VKNTPLKERYKKTNQEIFDHFFFWITLIVLVLVLSL